MKIVFMGTPDFAVPVLKELIKEHQVVCVYTRAPALSGRGKALNKTPVHLVAEENGIEVRTPKTLRDPQAQKDFADLKADIAIVAAYGLILPKAVIEAFPLGCLNVHASLLPRWRGAAPIQRSIEAGDKQSGVTIMRVVEALDAGAMYKKGVVEITPETTGGLLHDQLSEIGASLMSDVLKNLDSITPEEQNEAEVTYASKLDKDEARLDFSKPAEILERKIRAFNPFPSTFFEYKDERFKILKATPIHATAAAGTIINGKDKLIIACGEDALQVDQIQRQGKKSMTIDELLNGYSFEEGMIIK